MAGFGLISTAPVQRVLCFFILGFTAAAVVRGKSFKKEQQPVSTLHYRIQYVFLISLSFFISVHVS